MLVDRHKQTILGYPYEAYSLLQDRIIVYYRGTRKELPLPNKYKDNTNIRKLKQRKRYYLLKIKEIDEILDKN